MNILVMYSFVFFGIFLVDILRDLFLLIKCFFLEWLWIGNWVCWLKVGEEYVGWSEIVFLFFWCFDDCMLIRLLEENGFILMKDFFVLLVLIVFILWLNFELIDVMICLCVVIVVMFL